MNLCSENHEEVCYAGNTCPVCEIIKEYDDEIDNLNDELNLMQAKLDAG